MPKSKGYANSSLELEDDLSETIAEAVDSDTDSGMVEIDNNEGWIDEIALLTAAERVELEGNIQPVKMILSKVRLNKGNLHTMLTNVYSYENLPSRLSIQQHFYSQSGSRWSEN